MLLSGVEEENSVVYIANARHITVTIPPSRLMLAVQGIAPHDGVDSVECHNKVN